VIPTPDEPLEEGSDRDESALPPYGADPAPRGWIDPDDRLWRHPSELAQRAAAATHTRPIAIRHPRAVVLVGAAATLAALAWAIVLLSPASDHPASPTTSENAIPITTLAVNEAMPVAADAASHSMVQLEAVTSHGSVALVGVAVAEGGLVATTANGLSGLRSIYMVSSDGSRQKASVLAVDDASDLALVSVPDDVPVATFADDAELTLGSADMTLSMVQPVDGTLVLHCQQGSVTGIDAVIPNGWAKGMPAITSAATPVSQEAGDPLLNQDGDVIGILYDSGTSASFLPTQLVLGVADDLRSTGHVSHGWLGVQGVTASGSGGAQVAALMKGSPAAGILHPGDVVTAMGSVPIRSMADLRGRLYVTAPDSTIGLSVADGSTIRVVDVTLSASP
jgi:putative serine protease PepD